MKDNALEQLKYRSMLIRCTQRTDVQGCRTPILPLVEMKDRSVRPIELGYFCLKGNWALNPLALATTCTTPGCVMHVGYVDDDDKDMQLVADRQPVRTLAELFRRGRSRGWFRSSGGYAN